MDIDQQFDPSSDPTSSQPWLNLIDNALSKFKDWQETSDRIDKVYSDLNKLANRVRDEQFSMFWSNIQIMAPSIYARVPEPIVTPEFHERDPVKGLAAQVLQRTAKKSFEIDHMDRTMRLLRDDLLITARGVPWVRYETKDKKQKVCIEFKDRKDFVHDPARYWHEVDWVAGAAYLTRKQMKERFDEEKAAAASYAVQKNTDDTGKGLSDPQQRCRVWEVWCKSENKVVWVTEGVEDLLDSDKPHLDLDNFFPCPEPAYATKQRRSLIPVPDMLYYEDQLVEINKLTNRIAALTEAVRVKGFYPGGGDVGDAVEAALKISDDSQIMIPVSNLAAFGQGGANTIVWLPIDIIMTTIQGLIAGRAQVIDDVYQITGLSDIMRGATDAEETFGAQKLKQQNGSVRVKDKQNELVRVARDCTRIMVEIMAEKFSQKTLLDMSQMELPTRDEQKKRIRKIEQDAQRMAESPQAQQMAEQEPQRIEQMMQEVRIVIQQIEQEPTIDDVMELLRDQRIRPFSLDIETDSTIMPDEMAEKESRAAFLDAFSRATQAVTPLLELGKAGAALAGGMLKFALQPYRVGEELEGMIEDFIQEAPAALEQQRAEAQGEGIDEAMTQATQQLAQAEVMKAQAQTAKVQADAANKQQEIRLKAAEAQMKDQEAQAKFRMEMEGMRSKVDHTNAQIEKIYAEIQKMGVDSQNATRTQDRDDFKTVVDTQARQTDQQMSAERDARAAAQPPAKPNGGSRP